MPNCASLWDNPNWSETARNIESCYPLDLGITYDFSDPDKVGATLRDKIILLYSEATN